MELNISAFGAGVGVVLVGWLAGIVVSYVFEVVRGISRIG